MLLHGPSLNTTGVYVMRGTEALVVNTKNVPLNQIHLVVMVMKPVESVVVEGCVIMTLVYVNVFQVSMPPGVNINHYMNKNNHLF